MPYGCLHLDYDLQYMLRLFYYWLQRFKEVWALQSMGRTTVFLRGWEQRPTQTFCRFAKPRFATSRRVCTAQYLLELTWEI
jgi:hypothetical protein